MPHVATEHARHAGKIVGSGHCVPFVQLVAELPTTNRWRRGDPVQGAGFAPGTAIGTFGPDGRYTNRTDGSAHCAILLAEHDDGSLTVWDCWLGQPVHQRVIRNRQGRGDAVDDSSRFYAIETV